MNRQENVHDVLSCYYFFLYYLLIAGIWQLYEELRFGDVMPDPFHTVVAFLLALLLAKDHRTRINRQTP